MELDEYLPALRRANARFDDAAAEAVLAHGWSAPVPGCPDWRWPTWSGTWPRCSTSGRGWCARGPPIRPPTPSPPRHPDDELLGWLAAQHAELETALAGADPAERVWTWAPQQDVAFVLRRQVQEAVVHTVDVEQVLGDVRPIPADVGLDGLDEWLEVMVPGGAAGRAARERAPGASSTPWTPTRERTLFPGTPAVPDRRPDRHRRRPAAGGLAAGAARGAHRRRRRAPGRGDDRPRPQGVPMSSPVARLSAALPVTGHLVDAIEPGSGRCRRRARLDGARRREPPGARSPPVRRRAAPVARRRHGATCSGATRFGLPGIRRGDARRLPCGRSAGAPGDRPGRHAARGRGLRAAGGRGARARLGPRPRDRPAAGVPRRPGRGVDRFSRVQRQRLPADRTPFGPPQPVADDAPPTGSASRPAMVRAHGQVTAWRSNCPRRSGCRRRRTTRPGRVEQLPESAVDVAVPRSRRAPPGRAHLGGDVVGLDVDVPARRRARRRSRWISTCQPSANEPSDAQSASVGVGQRRAGRWRRPRRRVPRGVVLAAWRSSSRMDRRLPCGMRHPRGHDRRRPPVDPDASHRERPGGRGTQLRTAARAARATRRWARGAARCAAARRPAAACVRTSRRVRCSCSCSPRSPRSSSAEPLQHLDRLGRQRLAGPAPQQGAQLGVDGEADAVVDAVHVAVGHRDDVAALAVGVVHDRVEHRHPAQGRVVAAHERRQVDVVVAVDPELHHARAERALAQHGRRHDPPAGRLRDQEGRDLAAGERAVGEVPERPLPRHRLVDALADERRRSGSCRRGSRCWRRASGPRGRSRPRAAAAAPRRRPPGARSVRLDGLLAHRRAAGQRR